MTGPYFEAPESDEDGVRYVEVEGEAADEFAALTGSMMDVEFALRAARRLLQRFPDRWVTDSPQTDDDIELTALWRAALVAYVRAHLGGVRPTLRVLDGQPTEVLESHAYFKALRDKHVVHSVNAMEQVKTMVGFRRVEAGVLLENVAWFGAAQTLSERSDVEAFIHLCENLSGLIEAALDEVKERVGEEAARIGGRALLAGQASRIDVPDRTHVARSRRTGGPTKR